MRLKIINSYIVGYGAFGNQDYPEYDWNDFDGQFKDEYGNYKYQLIDGKIILNPQKPTAEQLEAKRKQTIVEEIRKKYSIDDELAILFRGTKEEKDKHEADVTAIKMGAT